MPKKPLKKTRPPPLTIWLLDDQAAQRKRILDAVDAAEKRLGYKISTSAWLLRVALEAADKELGARPDAK